MTLSLQFVQEQYESNPDSPLFVYYANLLLQSGDTAGAYQVCSDGLEQHPEFATGWFLLGMISKERGESAFAKTCWMNALSNDHMALNAATSLLELEDLELSDEEIRTAAQLVLQVDSENELANTRLEELATHPKEQVEQDAPDAEESEVGTRDERKSDFDHDGVVESPEEIDEDSGGSEEIPSEVAGDEVFRRTFEKAVEGQPGFEPPEFEAEVTEEDVEKRDEDFAPPEFQAEVLDKDEEISAEESNGETEDEDVSGDRAKPEETEGLDYDIFDMEPDEIESVMEILRSRFGDEYDTAEVSRETMDAIRKEIQEKQPESDAASTKNTQTSDNLYDEVSADINELQEESSTDTDSESAIRPQPALESAAFMSEQGSIKITERMATFTFADVLKSQGLYDQAYQVLELMRNKSEEIERIESEQTELKELIEAKRASNRTRE